MSHDERVTHPDQHAAADTADPVGSPRLQPSSASQEDQLGQAGREDDPDTAPVTPLRLAHDSGSSPEGA